MVALDESGLAQDWQAIGRMNATGALMGMTFLTVVLFDGCLNWEVFYAWLTEDLLPKTAAGTVIVIVNASFHKRPDMLEPTRTKQCCPGFFQPTAKAIRRQYWCGVDGFFPAHSHNMSFYNDLAISVPLCA